MLLRLCLLLLAFLSALPAAARETGPDAYFPAIQAAALPAEARQTLTLIQQGGPFPYYKDGAVFGNYEKRLPIRPRGHYREYTVPTPGIRGRGARRIVAGRGEAGDVRASGEYYYTDDHYRSFRKIRP
ncbi:MAG: ribonuclease N1 [Zoogloeaceae bacterium]|jgi:ribonuclease T1|nr:ribonuclease N1 [Zoogloeaceae bacterium]